MKGFAKWILIGLLVIVFLAVISFFWGSSAASRKAGTETTPTPVAMTATNVEDCPRVLSPEKAESVTPPKAEPDPEPVKADPPKSDPAPQSVPIADPPKAEVKDPATAMPGDIVGTVNPDIKDWPTSQTPEPNDPVLFFGSEAWKNARRRVWPDGSFAPPEVFFMVEHGTPVVLPFDVRVEHVGGDARIMAISKVTGEKKEILLHTVAIELTPAPKDFLHEAAGIVFYLPVAPKLNSEIVRAGNPIFAVEASEWVFLDTALGDNGLIRINEFNVSVDIGGDVNEKIPKEAAQVPGTYDLFFNFTNWWTGKAEMILADK